MNAILMIKAKEENDLVMNEPIKQILSGLQYQLQDQLLDDKEREPILNEIKIYEQFQHFANIVNEEGVFMNGAIDINTLKVKLMTAISKSRNKMESNTLNYKRVSKCLIFINKCRAVPWMESFDESTYYENMKVLLNKCEDTVITYLEEYSTSQDKELRKHFDVLLNINDNTIEYNTLLNHVHSVSDVLFECDKLKKREKEYSNIIQHVYEDNDMYDKWKMLIHAKYKELKHELQRLSGNDAIKLNTAIERARILSNIDFFLESHMNIRNGFSDLYLQYLSVLTDNAVDLDVVSNAIRNHNFLQTSLLMEQITQIQNVQTQKTYAHAQNILNREISEIYTNAKSQIIQLTRNIHTQQDNNNIHILQLKRQFNLINDIETYCSKHIMEKDKQLMQKTLSQSTSLLYKHMEDISLHIQQFTDSYKFESAEQYLLICKDLLNHLSELFGDKIQEMAAKCQNAQNILSMKLNEIEKTYKHEIQFDDKIIVQRMNLYSINSVQIVYNALIEASTTNPKYRVKWKDIEDDIKKKFRELLKKPEKAKTYKESVNILYLCDDILNSLPTETRNELKHEYKAASDLITTSNREQIELLDQYLKDNEWTSIYVLYNEMKKKGNRKMTKMIQNKLSDTANAIRIHLNQAIISENSVDIRDGLYRLSQLSGSFPSNEHYNQIEIEYATARTKVETFISDKIEWLQTSVESIKHEIVNEIQQNLDTLFSLFKSNTHQNTKGLRDTVNKYSDKLSKFINKYFDESITMFNNALQDLDSIKMNDLLNKMKLFDSKQSEIMPKLQLFDNIRINPDANYEVMITKTSDKLKTVKNEILNTHLINKQIQRNAQNEQYKHFLNLKHQLSSLKQCHKLKSHINEQELKDYYRECIITLKVELQDIINNLKNKLEDVDALDENKCDYINDHYRILLAMDKANVFVMDDAIDDDHSSNNPLQLKTAIDTITNLIGEKLSSLERKVMQSMLWDKADHDQITDALIEMEIVSTILLDFKENTKLRIDKCLKAFKSQHATEINSLYSILLHKQQVWANHILQTYSIFNGIAISKFNQFTKAFDIEYVLNNIEGIGDDINTNSKKDFLKRLFIECKTKYEELVAHYLLPPEKIDLYPLISKIKSIPRGVKQRKNEITWDVKTKQTALSLISHIFALWTLQNSASYFEFADASDPRSYLLQPRDPQIVSIFRILGIGNTAESYSEKVWNGLKDLASKVSFGLVNFNTKSEILMPNLVEIGTGEGKSLTLAVASSVLALLGFNVNCVCYSKYLSERDYKSFERMFIALGIHDNIVYGTFNELCENIINENGNIRDIVHDLILPRNTNNNNDNDDAYGDNTDTDRANVLLIDEVDVFFNKQFYGEYYTPGTALKHECIRGITNYIWSHYANNGFDSTLHLGTIKNTNEYKQCIVVFTEKWLDIMDEQIKCMLADINTFDSPQYVVKHDKIGYKEGDQISYTATVGYKTLFAYYYEHYEKKIISEQSLNNMIAFYLKCGTFSYAEIPKKFNVILGVTGTLKHLSEPELDTMENKYGLKVHTYMPSLFGENKIEFDEKKDILITTIERFNEDLKNEIRTRLKQRAAPRCVFVFFEDATKLKSFYDSKEFITFQDKTRILTEQLTFEEKEAEVTRAPQSNTISLLTRSFGRGTDFKVLDDLVRNNGGPHVIQTFVSLELSEEIQIKGRTARNGGHGSYSMVLIDEELEKFGIAKQEIETAQRDDTLYELIDGKRRTEFAKEYAQTTDRIQTATEIHENGEAFLHALHTNNVGKIKQDLLSYNLGPSSSTLKIAICVDATGSMGSLLHRTKERIREMFKRIREILQESKKDPNSFEIQFIAYRNYNAPADELLLSSGWQNNPNELDTFLKNVFPVYGWGNEAIEVALEFLNNDHNVNEAIIIGDMPPNTRDDVTNKRKSRTESYWENTKFKIPTYFDDELKKLKHRGLKLNSFYLTSYAKNDFEKMASETGGKCDKLDIDSSEGAEQLTGIVAKTVLNVCGGAKLVEAYDAKFNFTHIS